MDNSKHINTNIKVAVWVSIIAIVLQIVVILFFIIYSSEKFNITYFKLPF